MTDNESDDGWEIVPIDTPQSPVGNDTKTSAPSRSLIELRISIGYRHCHHCSRSGHKCRNNPTSLPSEHSLLERPPLPQEQSLLFQIPVEIRLYIYELVFTLSPEAKMTTQTTRGWQNGHYSALTLLQTCRLVLYEAESIFYSINRFRLELDTIPPSLSSHRRESINALAIIANKSTTVWNHISTLHLVPNLQSLYIVSPTESLRFVDVQSWKIMLAQMETQLKKLERLKEVKVLWNTSAPNMPEPGEMDRLLKLDQVAKRLEACVVPS